MDGGRGRGKENASIALIVWERGGRSSSSECGVRWMKGVDKEGEGMGGRGREKRRDPPC